jgi:hypothetical protein
VFSTLGVVGSLVLTLVFMCLGFRGEYGFCIEKACALVAALLSFELGVYHPYDLVLRESWCFILYICIFCFSLIFFFILT